MKTKPKPPQLFVLCQLFFPELISTGQTLTELCEELVKFGVNVEVICGPPTILDTRNNIPKCIQHNGITIRRVWGTRFPKLNTLGKAINHITFTFSVLFYLLFHPPKGPILVLTNPPFLAIISALLRILRIGKPYIYLIFDIYPDTAVRLGVLKEKGLISRVWNRLNMIVYKYSSAIVVIGRCMKEVVSRKITESGLSINGKLHNIHVWSDDNLIRSHLSMDNPFVKRWNLDGRFIVGYCGNMSRGHDMETIMEAAEILKENKDVVFLFVGEGYKKQWMMDYAKKHELGNCQFYTYVKREDLGDLLSLVDLGLVCLSEGHEGLSVPSKTFGLMAAGVPIIAVMSPFSEIARIIEEEDCGILVRPGQKKQLSNSILDLYNHRERLKIMGRNASRVIDTKYNLHQAAKKYLELILNIGN